MNIFSVYSFTILNYFLLFYRVNDEEYAPKQEKELKTQTSFTNVRVYKGNTLGQYSLHCHLYIHIIKFDDDELQFNEVDRISWFG